MADRFYLAGRSRYGFYIVHDRDEDRSASFVPEFDIEYALEELNGLHEIADSYVWDSPRREPPGARHESDPGT